MRGAIGNAVGVAKPLESEQFDDSVLSVGHELQKLVVGVARTRQEADVAPTVAERPLVTGANRPLDQPLKLNGVVASACGKRLFDDSRG